MDADRAGDADRDWGGDLLSSAATADLRRARIRREIMASYNFYPRCQFQTAPVCERCFNGVKMTDAYCINCGRNPCEGQAPARLQALGEGPKGLLKSDGQGASVIIPC